MGCHIDNIFVVCIAYADDSLLLSACVVHLHKMLEISQSHANMHFGAGNITWVDTMKHLGINFVSSKRVKIDIYPFLHKFYALVNAVMAQSEAPCGLRGCKNGPAMFPGWMSYKATKSGLVFVLYLTMFLLCCLLGPVFMYC